LGGYETTKACSYPVKASLFQAVDPQTQQGLTGEFSLLIPCQNYDAGKQRVTWIKFV